MKANSLSSRQKWLISIKTTLLLLVILPGMYFNTQRVADAAIQPSTPIIVGEWDRTDGIDRYKIFANRTLQTVIEGKIYHGTWSYDGPGGYKYIFDWEHRPSPEKAPFKDWITVAPDGQSYSGYNNYGDHVHCIRISHDISLDDACLIQVVKDPKTLIVDKKAAICVNVTSTFKDKVKADIEVVYDFGRETYVEKGSDGGGVLILPGMNTIYLPGGPTTAENNSPWMEPGKGVFLYWTTTGEDRGITVTLDPENLIKEDNEDNNHLQLEAKVILSKGLKILYTWVYFPGAQDNVGKTLNQENIVSPTAEHRIMVAARIESDVEYLINQFPISEESVQVTINPQAIIWPETPTTDTFNSPDMYSWLYEKVGIPLSRWATLTGYDRVIIVIKEGQVWQDCALAMGYENPNPVPILWLDGEFTWNRSGYVLAHEVGHTYNLDHPFDVCQDIPELTDETALLYDVNSREYEKTVDNLMSYGEGPWWIDDQRYENYNPHPTKYGGVQFTLGNLKDQLRVSADPEIVLLSGTIYKNSTAVATEPWYRISSDTVDLVEGTKGNYDIVTVDEAGAILGRYGFNASFAWLIDINGTLVTHESESTPFFFRVQFKAGTTMIELRKQDGTMLFSRNVSSSSPRVKVDEPISGKIYNFSENVTLKWTASDPDGDSLIHTLFYSTDGGSSWIPLGISQTEASYLWNTKNLPESTKYRVKVISSDGVNVGEGLSSTFVIKPKEVSSGTGSIPGYTIGSIFVGVTTSVLILLLLRRRIAQKPTPVKQFGN